MYGTPRPSVVIWQKVYCVFLALAYFSLVALGIFLFAVEPNLFERDPEAAINAVVCIVVGLPLAALTGVAVILPRRRWAWIYNLVVIGLTLTSCACLPVAIPLLIFWLKDDVKEYYGV